MPFIGDAIGAITGAAASILNGASGPLQELQNFNDALSGIGDLNQAATDLIDAGGSTAVNIFAGKTGAPLSLTIANP